VGKGDPGATLTWKVDGGASAKGALSCKIENQTRNAVEA